MADPILLLENITRNFGDEVVIEVLKGIDLQIEPGEFTALVGPSGSGKSTLLNIMGLLDHPSSGEVVVAGEETSGLDDEAVTKLRAQTLGFIFQAHHLLTGFTALENVMMPAAVNSGSFNDEACQRATMLLENVGLKEHMHKNARHLSGGQQQRVAVARALTNEPELVLADEPTGNLDTQTAEQVFQLLKRINAETNTAFLIVTHDDSLAERCHRIIRLVDGQIVEDREARG